MTLKQFAMLGGCVLLAVIVAQITIIPPIFRYPIIGSLVVLGLAMAFLPIEERSLDVWLWNFVRSVYNPTLYLWKTSGKLPDFMTFESSRGSRPVNNVVFSRSDMIQPYLQSLQKTQQDPFEIAQGQKMQNISALFGTQPTQTTNIPARPAFAPLTTPNQKTNPTNTNPNQAATIVHMDTPVQQIPPAPSPSAFPNRVSVQPPNQHQNQPLIQTNPQPTPQAATPTPIITSAPLIQAPLHIASLKPEPPKPPKPGTELPYFTEDQMPPVPDIPNAVVGMVMTPAGQLLANTIVEIKDADGLPARAIKSNRLGQFFIATPLPSGKYTLCAEHDTYTFKTMTIEASGNIIQPIKLISNPS